MSNQVLARKWRPKTFQDLSGQQHVVQALINALQQNRLHHAYLFTGTRGVGKTTIARILAKCLNCEQGIVAEPCGTCKTCTEINHGCYIDLIEVDAASRTKVEDTRELLDNVQYAPTHGRFKVYLIDEVHMLSNHSFNALLKTLEEPPSHVKFLLATTDPQKLPVTVLSRCLQFHLKCLSPEQISTQLTFILHEEKIAFETEALKRLAHAAEGSMRDALSLLDQAIAYCGGTIETNQIIAMLGSIESTHLYDMMDALATQQAMPLIDTTNLLAEQAADFSQALEELITVLHQIAVLQVIPDLELDTIHQDKLRELSKKFHPEDIQLFYQIALIGRRDLPLNPSPKNGFEMILLRMLAFQPNQNFQAGSSGGQQAEKKFLAQEKKSAIIKPVTASALPEGDTLKQPVSEHTQNWQDIVAKLNLRGITAAIAAHCSLKSLTDNEIQLLLDPSQVPLFNKKQEERLTSALQHYFQKAVRVSVVVGEANMETPAALEQKHNNQLKADAEQAIQQDKNVSKLIEVFNAKIVPQSIEQSSEVNDA